MKSYKPSHPWSWSISLKCNAMKHEVHRCYHLRLWLSFAKLIRATVRAFLSLKCIICPCSTPSNKPKGKLQIRMHINFQTIFGITIDTGKSHLVPGGNQIQPVCDEFPFGIIRRPLVWGGKGSSNVIPTFFSIFPNKVWYKHWCLNTNAI